MLDEWNVFVRYYTHRRELPVMTSSEARLVAESTGRLPLYLSVICRTYAKVIAGGEESPCFADVWRLVHYQPEVQRIYADIKQRMREDIRHLKSSDDIAEYFDFLACVIGRETPQYRADKFDHRYIYSDPSVDGAVCQCSSGFAEDAFRSCMIEAQLHETAELSGWGGLLYRAVRGDPNDAPKEWLVEQLVITSLLHPNYGLCLKGLTNQSRMTEARLRPSQHRFFWDHISNK